MACRDVTCEVKRNVSSKMLVWTHRYLKYCCLSSPPSSLIDVHRCSRSGVRSGDIGIIGKRKLLVGVQGWLNIPCDQQFPAGPVNCCFDDRWRRNKRWSSSFERQSRSNSDRNSVNPSSIIDSWALPASHINIEMKSQRKVVYTSLYKVKAVALEWRTARISATWTRKKGPLYAGRRRFSQRRAVSKSSWVVLASNEPRNCSMCCGSMDGGFWTRDKYAKIIGLLYTRNLALKLNSLSFASNSPLTSSKLRLKLRNGRIPRWKRNTSLSD